MMEESRKPRSRKRILFVMISLIIIFIALIFVIKNIKIGTLHKPSDDQLLSIALKHPQVQAFLAGDQYTTDIRPVSKEDMDEMPVLFSGLSGDLYLIDFRVSDKGLKVVMDQKEVKKVFPITYVSVT
jgi:hypothetical protein